MILQNKAKKSFGSFMESKTTHVNATQMSAGQRQLGSGEFMNSDLMESTMRCPLELRF